MGCAVCGEAEYYPPSDPMQLSNAAGDPAHGAGVAHASQKLQDLAGKSGDDLRKAEVAETA